MASLKPFEAAYLDYISVLCIYQEASDICTQDLRDDVAMDRGVRKQDARRIPGFRHDLPKCLPDRHPPHEYEGNAHTWVKVSSRRLCRHLRYHGNEDEMKGTR